MVATTSLEKERARETRGLAAILNEPVMGFLALIALAVALGPLVFDLSPTVDRLFQAIEWTVVALFALEFTHRLALEADKKKWLSSRERILDVVTIGGPFLALLPGVSDAASGSLALRILRVGRAVAFGTRAGGALTKKLEDPDDEDGGARLRVACITDQATLESSELPWDSCRAWTSNPGIAWFHATHVASEQFVEAASAAGIDAQGLRESFAVDSPARLRTTEDRSAAVAFLTVPTVEREGFPKVERARVAIIITERSLLTATRKSVDLPTSVRHIHERGGLPTHPFPIRVTLAVLALALNRFLFTVQRFDQAIRKLDDILAKEGYGAFLDQTSRLRREISVAAFDSNQLRGIVVGLADGRRTLRGVNLKEDQFLDTLKEDAEALEERLKSLKEDVQSGIEVHLNMKSFEINKFLQLLAVISCLGLIPAVVGGMLGMNVVGNPWPITLGQVAFVVGMCGTAVLYGFAIKGWLR